MNRKLAGFVVAGVAVVAIGLLVLLRPSGTVADESMQVSVEVQTSDTNARTNIGDECGRAGLESNAAEYATTRQLVVENADGKIVSTSSLRRGVLKDGVWGRVCSVDVTISLPPSDFYTFAIFTDDFRYTFSRDDLESAPSPLVIATDV